MVSPCPFSTAQMQKDSGRLTVTPDTYLLDSAGWAYPHGSMIYSCVWTVSTSSCGFRARYFPEDIMEIAGQGIIKSHRRGRLCSRSEQSFQGIVGTGKIMFWQQYWVRLIACKGIQPRVGAWRACETGMLEKVASSLGMRRADGGATLLAIWLAIDEAR